ncbi:phosphoserine phosphatase RsbX [Pullulanibacillus camelliae]|uniref:Phosphoserine phosphatase RsbX n=1 Tax=Pullulanibacillus camelliae TaxID=1707096 RepID=A0A8J2VPN5_9BACL|nr:protein phosphatase 2C domain-containing protein [Pullulanibacillus camelliae]GGE34486.1 phosphoserine phosphatase RsbX [Pullulanibacillus camelliae]
MIERHPFERFSVNAFQKNKKGIDCCGDSFFVNETDNTFFCAVADGLGSGEAARKASQAAVKAIENFQNEPLERIMTKVNGTQRGLRGVVLSIFKLHLKSGVMEFCGVGNVKLKIFNEMGEWLRPVPKPGILAGQVMRFNIQRLKYPQNGWFAMYSDGIAINAKDTPTLKYLLHAESSDNIDIDPLLHSISANIVDDMTLLLGTPTKKSLLR